MPKKAREFVRTTAARTAVRAYIGLGSNLGDRAQHLVDAVRQLGAHGTVAGASPLYETAPLGPTQPPYINACAALDTTLDAEALLVALLAIEQAHGRVRAERWGPRSLDLDLLLYGSALVALPALTVPHPALAERGFVLAPLHDIAATVAVPGLNQTVGELWRSWIQRDGHGVQRYIGAGGTTGE